MEWLLRDNTMKRLYYNLLLQYKDRYGVSIYSYNFMDNHIHLTVKIVSLKLFSRFMQVVNSLFARAVNKKYGRRGQVVMDRFKSSLIQSDSYLMCVMYYNDLNITRCKKRLHPKDYKWCSYGFYAFGRDDPLITPSPSYLALGGSTEDRMMTYRNMIDETIRHDGLIRQDYSNMLFVGDAEWVSKRHEEVRLIQRQRRLCRASEQQQAGEGEAAVSCLSP